MSALELADTIHKEFVKTVDEAEVNSELKRFVLSHERKDIFLKNIALEVTKGRKFFLKQNIQLAVHDMTLLFLKNVERIAHERVMSDNEKSRLLKEAELNQEIEKQADEWADQIRIEHWDGKKKKSRTTH